MNKAKSTGLAALIALILSLGVQASVPERMLYDLSDGRQKPLAQLVPELRKNRIVFVGEHHTEPAHHINQLHIIQSLHEAGASVAIGMEMFRADSQPALGKWVAGKLSRRDFKKLYDGNWNFDLSLYAPILDYAREKGIPVVGLNVPREVTRQVARGGFGSLSEDQRAMLDEEIACRVDRVYMDFVKRAYGAHAHGQIDFTYFCEAQLVWDNAMALHALRYLERHPDAVMVVVAGNGHVWKGGIPTQIRKRSGIPHTVIFPTIPRVVEPGLVDVDDADYIMVD